MQDALYDSYRLIRMMILILSINPLTLFSPDESCTLVHVSEKGSTNEMVLIEY